MKGFNRGELCTLDSGPEKGLEAGREGVLHSSVTGLLLQKARVLISVHAASPGAS